MKDDDKNERVIDDTVIFTDDTVIFTDEVLRGFDDNSIRGRYINGN